jgi:hypothetical protein
MVAAALLDEPPIGRIEEEASLRPHRDGGPAKCP